MELISKLQPLKKLTVIASNSTMKFADSELSAKEIGKQLKAGSRKHFKRNNTKR